MGNALKVIIPHTTKVVIGENIVTFPRSDFCGYVLSHGIMVVA